MDIIKIITSFEFRTIASFILFAVSSASLFFVVHAFLGDVTHKHKIAFICISLILWSFAAISGYHLSSQLISVPVIAQTIPKTNGIINALAPSISFTFSAPVDFNSLSIHTYPAIDLDIKPAGYIGNHVSIGRTLTLSPKNTLPYGENYMVYLSNIEGPFTRGYGGEHQLDVHTNDLNIAEINPADTDTEIAPNQIFTVKFNQPILKTEWSVQTTPKHSWVIKQNNTNSITITPETPLPQATDYTMTIIHTPVIHRLATDEIIQKLTPTIKKIIRFTTVRPPLVARVEPQGAGVDPAAAIRIEFDAPMEQRRVVDHIQLTPAVNLIPRWDSEGKTLILTHEVFPKNTDYTISFKKGLQTITGGMTETNLTYQFHTAGSIIISQSNPINGATEVSRTEPIVLTFDQHVPLRITDYITFTPKFTATVSAQDKKVTFFPKTPLAYETHYKVTLKSGAPSIYGLPSSIDQTFSFTTMPLTLAVPYYHQQSAFTCNIAAARMLLAYRDVIVSEKNLIESAGLGGKRGSGNPYKGYIDDYGTYWDTVSRAVNTWRPTRLITSGKLADIITEINKGNPVMTWGQNGWSDPHDISWTATDGTFIQAINGMHSSVVRGYTGPGSNPTQILLNDPWRGQYGIATKEFMRRWGYFGIAMVVE